MKIRLREEKSEKGNGKRYFGCDRLCAADRGNGGAGVLAAVQRVRWENLMFFYVHRSVLRLEMGKQPFCGVCMMPKNRLL